MKWLEALVSEAHQDLDSSNREELYKRGVSDEQIDAYRIGCIDVLPDIELPERFTGWWESKVEPNIGQGVFVLPLTTTLGEVGGIQVRSTNRHRKGYLDFFACQEEAAFFGLSQAMPYVWRNRSIWLVEGAFDLFPIQRHISGVVATLTAGVSSSLWRILRRVANDVVIAYDADGAGRDAAYKIARSDQGKAFKITIAKFPNLKLGSQSESEKPRYTKDPSDLWSVWGDDRFGVFLAQYIDPLQQEV